MKRIILTRKGHEKLVNELTFLTSTKRKEVSDMLEKARAHGDLRENAEYDAAKEAKQHLEKRIAELANSLSNAQLLDSSQTPKDKAFLGASLEVQNVDNGDVFSYTLVAEDEADFEQGKIAVSSPIGKGLLGKKLNETVAIQVPAGTIKLKVIKINYEN